MTLTEIRTALAARNLRPLKQLGQNFLHDRNLTRWLADAALKGIEPGATVVEIGPGLGALTAELLQHDLHLVAIEKDRGLCSFLREHFAAEIANSKLELREGDALELLGTLGTVPALICGNLPYYISTPLLMECLRLTSAPLLFFLMQQEVGQRLASRPGGKIYGALSVIVQTSYHVDLVRTLPGSVFHPPPEVESVAVRLTPLAQPLLTLEERESFRQTVQRGFSQRRKKLSNLLPTQDGRRAEHLNPVEWIALWREIGAEPKTT